MPTAEEIDELSYGIKQQQIVVAARHAANEEARRTGTYGPDVRPPGFANQDDVNVYENNPRPTAIATQVDASLLPLAVIPTGASLAPLKRIRPQERDDPAGKYYHPKSYADVARQNVVPPLIPKEMVKFSSKAWSPAATAVPGQAQRSVNQSRESTREVRNDDDASRPVKTRFDVESGTFLCVPYVLREGGTAKRTYFGDAVRQYDNKERSKRMSYHLRHPAGMRAAGCSYEVGGKKVQWQDFVNGCCSLCPNWNIRKMLHTVA